MPVEYQGPPSGNIDNERIQRLAGKDFKYDYPYELNFRPTKSLSNKIVQAVINRARASRSDFSCREDSLSEIEKSLNTYINLSDIEKKRKNRFSEEPVSIVVPYSTAALETILTYLTMAFLNQRPIFPLDSVSSEDTVNVKLMEVLIQRQIDFYKAPLDLYVWMRDGLAYGSGAVLPYWKEAHKMIERKTNEQEVALDGTPLDRNRSIREPTTIFQGTALTSVGPRYMLPDPTSSIHKIQEGAYFGWIEETNQYKILDLEKVSGGSWFNGKYLYQAGPMRSQYRVSDDSYQDSYSKPTTLIHMYVKVIPADWGLPAAGDKDYPELWYFVVADDWVVIKAERVELSHGMMPVAINAPDFDGYSSFPMSRIEQVQGLQTTLNWLFNSHISNVRKSINNILVVDPTAVEFDDLKNARRTGGGIVRLKPNAFGKMPKDAVYQLNVHDVTRGNIADAQMVIDLMQRVSAATDNIMGIWRPGSERRSATEARNVMASATNRVEKIARLISIMGLQDLGYFYAVNTQDYTSEEYNLKVLGDWPEELVSEFGLGQDVEVNPNALNVPFDVVVRDGSLPMDTGGKADIWMQMLPMMQNNPVLMKQYDMGRVFMHVMQLLGVKNVQDFRIKGETRSTAEIIQEVEKGNMVSMDEAENV